MRSDLSLAIVVLRSPHVIGDLEQRVSKASAYHGDVPDESEFKSQRVQWREDIARDPALQDAAYALAAEAFRCRYNYQWEWCGIPVIRTPDDICLLQEVVHDRRPTGMIELGIARGGGLVLSASLMAIAGLQPRVLGLDIAILPHTRSAISKSNFSSAIEMHETSSTGARARAAIASFISRCEPGPILATLDSDHTHDHVLQELRMMADLVPIGSVVIVADTAIEHVSGDVTGERPWGPGNSPASALKQFLAESPDFTPMAHVNRRALISECRDGFIEKVGGSRDLDQVDRS